MARTPRTAPVARTRGTPKEVLLGKIVNVVAESNPKRGKAADRFSQYRNGQTVSAYVRRLAKLGISEDAAIGDARWDSKKGFIRLEDKTTKPSA